MMTPDDIDVWVGLDVGKSALFCFNVCSTGSAVFFRSVG